MINDLSLDGSSVRSEVRTHELPHLVSSLLRRIVFELRLLVITKVVSIHTIFMFVVIVFQDSKVSLFLTM